MISFLEKLSQNIFPNYSNFKIQLIYDKKFNFSEKLFQNIFLNNSIFKVSKFSTYFRFFGSIKFYQWQH